MSILYDKCQLMCFPKSSLPWEPLLPRTCRSPEINCNGFLQLLSALSEDHHSDGQDYIDHNKSNYSTNFYNVCYEDGHKVSRGGNTPISGHTLRRGLQDSLDSHDLDNNETGFNDHKVKEIPIYALTR